MSATASAPSSSRGTPGEPIYALRGARVLVPRAGSWGDRVARELETRGATPAIAPLIQTVPPRDTAARDTAFAALVDGRYEWLFVTSAASVEQLATYLAAHGLTLPEALKIAVVGRATARAVIDLGAQVSFVPLGRSSAQTMIAQWCAAHAAASTGRCLVVRSDLAAAVVSDELELQGFAVDVCIGYRTVGLDLAPEVAADLAGGRFHVVLLTSLSVGRELRRQVGTLPLSTLVASIGPATTRDAERLGFTVGHTAHTQSIDALIAELDYSPRLLEVTS
ncbi:uroporphyrinogen-III synthase [Microbacterium sp. VKM Ac-2870]|uniref:uroporphyrinogen-III synthase n=1 Tax=Microbacterium sp. VKM Ac-2870 TaxID=2783825 RepID=UPI002B269F1A|nr:uroporphyrinogen-III synthase [Microbacterium sp. VKM Ac-2870]